MLAETQAIIAILVGVVALYYPTKKVVSWIWYKLYRKKVELLEDIRKELKPNGGTSLRDALDRIEERQYTMESFLLTQLNIYETAIFRADAAGKVYYTNRKHQRLTGFSLPEVEDDGWINYVTPSSRQETLMGWLDAVSRGREFHERMTLVKPDGEEYEVTMATFKELDKHGNITGYLGVITPV